MAGFGRWERALSSAASFRRTAAEHAICGRDGRPLSGWNSPSMGQASRGDKKKQAKYERARQALRPGPGPPAV